MQRCSSGAYSSCLGVNLRSHSGQGTSLLQGRRWQINNQELLLSLTCHACLWTEGGSWSRRTCELHVLLFDCNDCIIVLLHKELEIILTRAEKMKWIRSSRKRFRSSNKVNNYYNHPIEIHPKHSLFAQQNAKNALWQLPGRAGVESQRCGRLPWESGCSENDTVVQVCLVRAPFIWTQSSSKTHWWIRLAVSHSVSLFPEKLHNNLL